MPMHCVRLDLTMPQLTGDQVTRELRASDPLIPLVVMSGYSKEEVMARFAELQTLGSLSKPFRPPSLRPLLEQRL